jgi:hypothetical protein
MRRQNSVGVEKVQSTVAFPVGKTLVCADSITKRFVILRITKFVREIKARRMRQAGQLARIRKEIRTILMRKHEERLPLGRTACRLDDYITTDLQHDRRPSIGFIYQ